MPSPLTCPACGSPNVQTLKEQGQYGTPYGPTFVVELHENVCDACGMDGDFGKSNDEIIQGALNQSGRDGMKSMLKKLGESGVQPAYIARVLGLSTPPARYSDEMAALLRIITTYPWILEVADARFAPGAALKHLVKAAAKATLRAVARVW